MTATDMMACIPVAHRLAEAARPIALRYFRTSGLGVDDKSSPGVAYDPVTLADREIERAMRDILAAQRPGDGILGEEYDAVPSRSGITWVLDPIDGTRAFLCGLPNWGVLIAVNDGARPVYGIMDQPFTGERFAGGIAEGPAGTGGSATLHHGTTVRPLSAGDTTTLAESLMCCTDPTMFRGDAERAAFARMTARVRMTRYGTDCTGYALLAMGQVDLVVESSLKPYDIQALMPIIEAAGGVVTDWQGGDAQHGGQVIAAATPALHAAAISVLDGP